MSSLAAHASWAAPTPVDSGVLAPTPIDEETYTESFVAFIDGKDGTYFKVQLGVSNVGQGDGKGACGVFLARDGGPPWQVERLVERDWSYSEGRLRMGTCKASAGDALVFEGEVDGRAFSLTLYARAQRERVQRVDVGSRFYESDVLVPWARAKLVVRPASKNPGEVASIETEGHGYADHSRSTTYPSDSAKRWIRFRGLNTDAKHLILVREPKSANVDGWIWTTAGRSSVERMRLQVRGPKNHPQLRVWIDGEGGPFRVTSHGLISRYAPLEDRGVLGSLVGMTIGNPVTYTYRAVLETKGGPKISGILEMAISDE